MTAGGSPRIAAVVVTRDRRALLARCLDAIRSQDRRPDQVIVVDNGSALPVRPLLEHCPGAGLIRLEGNAGPAASFGRAIREAVAARAGRGWMMADAGQPAAPAGRARLLATLLRERADLVSPLVRDIEHPERLAFPIRLRGRTRFCAADLDASAPIAGFAHLFNGALVPAATFQRIGLPDPRLFIRGDEVEFLLRMRRRGLRVLTDPAVAFLPPSSNREVHPILCGWFYAIVPDDARKRFYQFRNRGWIFRSYGMWGWLAADHVRYAAWYLLQARDPAGYRSWLRLTWAGILGRLHPPDGAAAGCPVPILETVE